MESRLVGSLRGTPRPGAPGKPAAPIVAGLMKHGTSKQAGVSLDGPATACPHKDHVQVLAAHLNPPVPGWRLRAFGCEVPRLGGFLASRCDGEPDGQRVWRGR